MRRARRTLFPVFSPLLSIRDFGMLIRKAEERSLRSGTRYTMILISPVDGNRRNSSLKMIVSYVIGRIRTTDDIGWYDDCRIGILLAGAGKSGVEQLIRDIRKRLGNHPDRLEISVSGIGRREPAKEGDGNDFPDSLSEA